MSRMRWRGKAGLLLVSLVAVGAVATASASAAEYQLAGLPELGRCVKVAPKTGEYSGRSCLHPAPGKGRWSWLPGNGAKAKFKVFAESPVLTTAKETITCAFGEAEGAYTGPKTSTVKLVLSDCQQAGAKTALQSWCQNVGAFRGEVSTNELTGELGFIEYAGKKGKVGWDLQAKTGKALATFECGGASEVGERGTGTGTPMEIEGSVIGRVTKINRMTEENFVSYVVKSGVQLPEKFEGGVKDTLTVLVGLTKTAEAGTLSTVAEITNEEPLEIKAR